MNVSQRMHTELHGGKADGFTVFAHMRLYGTCRGLISPYNKTVIL